MASRPTTAEPFRRNIENGRCAGLAYRPFPF
jgi:hypothetical protein